MVIGHGDPPLGGGLQAVLRDALLTVVDGHGAVEGDPHPDRAPRQGPRHAVAIAADLDVGVPGDVARLPVRRVVAPGRQRLEGRRLPGEALGHDLVEGAVHAGVGFLAEPLLGELVEMRPALEGPVADEEVMLDVADVAFVLPFGLGARRPTGPGAEAVVPRQVEEPGMELTSPPRRWARTAAF